MRLDGDLESLPLLALHQELLIALAEGQVDSAISSTAAGLAYWPTVANPSKTERITIPPMSRGFATGTVDGCTSR